MSPYDVVFLSVKSYDLAAAMDDFAPAVGPQTVTIPVLNGMHHMDMLTERFGKSAVVGGVCYVATEVDSQGRISQRLEISRQAELFPPSCFFQSSKVVLFCAVVRIAAE